MDLFTSLIPLINYTPYSFDDYELLLNKSVKCIEDSQPTYHIITSVGEDVVYVSGYDVISYEHLFKSFRFLDGTRITHKK